MKWLKRLIGLPTASQRARGTSLMNGRRRKKPCMRIESLERREVFSADPLPVLLVIADQRDFYYKEYGDTRIGLEAEGLSVQVAATTTNPSRPHPGTGEPAGTDGTVVPDVALANVDAADYSAIVFVGGWGSSMYQYAFEGTYANAAYNGDLATKEVVNDLINDFADQDKHVAAVCHGVTVLAWARVDGVSPLSGRQAAVPFIGSPAVSWNGQYYGYNQLSQSSQVSLNGGTPSAYSGARGPNPYSVADDVVVDGRIITGENFDSALTFGHIVGQQVLASTPATPDPDPQPEPPPPPVNNAPQMSARTFSLQENSAANTLAGNATGTDVDVGQTLTYAITAGNTNNAFAINAVTGAITVANAAAIDFETNPVFQLTVAATDNGAPVMSAAAQVTVNLTDVVEIPPAPPAPVSGVTFSNGDLTVRGTSGTDYIYVWSTTRPNQVMVYLAGRNYGPYDIITGSGAALTHVKVFSGAGNDYVYATDSRVAVEIHGGDGNDQITGGHGNDVIFGGAGGDRISGMAGNDLIRGEAGNDQVSGGAGHDVLLGGLGDDQMDGVAGHDFLFGGEGRDYLKGGDGDDLLIGGTTSFDNNDAMLLALHAAWMTGGTATQRANNIASVNGQTGLIGGTTVFDDATSDIMCAGAGVDVLFGGTQDWLYSDALDVAR